jgi:hypothetical protein
MGDPPEPEKNAVKPAESIILCEPQCGGVAHVPFNAALLYTVRLAYPSAEIAYYGEQSHLDYVRDHLRVFHDVEGIDFEPIRIPRYSAYDQRRLPREFSICRRVLAEACRRGSRALVFSSVTNTSLLSLKALMHIKRFHVPTTAVVHGCLSGILDRQPRKPWNWITDLRRVLALAHPRSLKLMVLGDSILNNVRRVQPKRHAAWSALDHVYLWSSNAPEARSPRNPGDEPLQFGYLGASFKGFDTFCRLADDVASSSKPVQFVMAGFCTETAAQRPVCRHIPNIPDNPLPREEFEEQVRRLSYVVWTADPGRYRLVASGTFLDAMAFLKPGIYLRNDFIEHYFDRMGDIGYLCDSYEAMVETIKKIISEFPSDRYQRQVENIRKGRVIFEPETLAPRLRHILDGSPV